jgi:hypothetical protein
MPQSYAPVNRLMTPLDRTADVIGRKTADDIFVVVPINFLVENTIRITF